jgi:hypothetical protein
MWTHGTDAPSPKWDWFDRPDADVQPRAWWQLPPALAEKTRRLLPRRRCPWPSAAGPGRTSELSLLDVKPSADGAHVNGACEFHHGMLAERNDAPLHPDGCATRGELPETRLAGGPLTQLPTTYAQAS